jgi:hypothetical protein
VRKKGTSASINQSKELIVTVAMQIDFWIKTDQEISSSKWRRSSSFWMQIHHGKNAQTK